MNQIVYQTFKFCKTHLNICLLSVLIVITAFQLLFPDFVQFGRSLKWDGENYIQYALHFPEIAFGQKLDIYYFQRIFPSGVVYYGAKLFDIPLTEENVFFLFLWLNILLIFISFGIWLLVCKQLYLSNRGKFLGFTGLFINFALLKMPFYYPVLTDIMAFTLGITLLYFYLSRSMAGLLLTGLIGVLTFPTVFYSSLLLWVFTKGELKPNSLDVYKLWNKRLALLTALGFLLLIIVFYFYRQVPLINPSPVPVMSISIICVLVYLYLVTRFFYRADVYVQTIKDVRTWIRSLAAILILAVVYSILLWGASNEPSPLNYKGFLANIVVLSIANPFAFLVSHTVYLGPVFLVLLYFLRSFAEQINNYGLGVHVLMLGYVLLSVNSETRLFINAWPFFVAFLCKALEKTDLPVSFYLFVFLAALALSKFWYRIEVDGFSENYFNFPEQKYFMSIGPWMSDAMYLLQGAIVLLLFFWMHWFYFKWRKISSVK